MTDTQLGTFADLLDQTVVPLRPVLSRLRELVLDIDPNAVEVVRLGDRAATYGIGPRKMIDGYAYILPHKNWINLGFYQGSALTDPAHLLEGTGKNLRHVKIRSLTNADSPDLRRLIETAVAARRGAGG